jgi:hypothetical protein
MTVGTYWHSCLRVFGLAAADPAPPPTATLPNRADTEPRRSYHDVLLTDSQRGALLHDGYVSIEI